MDNRNYAQWKKFHFHWDSLEHFEGMWDRLAGIHTIEFGNGEKSVDLYVNEHIKNTYYESTPVFFSGAISNRTKQLGPFFSGLGVTRKLDLPLISIADPALDDDPSLKLAWYLGGPTDNFGENLARTLDVLQRILNTELILIGGSGGGFAALSAGLKTKIPTTTFVWNPQTDIFEYSSRFVKEYLRSQFNFSHATLRRTDWKDYCRIRTDQVMRTSVVDERTLANPRRVVYLQNETDSHRVEHLEPLWNVSTGESLTVGNNLLDDNHVVFTGEFAAGHAPPSVELIGAVLGELMDTDRQIRSIESLNDVIKYQ